MNSNVIISEEDAISILRSVFLMKNSSCILVASDQSVFLDGDRNKATLRRVMEAQEKKKRNKPLIFTVNSRILTTHLTLAYLLSTTYCGLSVLIYYGALCHFSMTLKQANFSASNGT